MSEQEILEQKIAELEEENLHLKRRIEDLEKELNIAGYIRKETDPMTISSYYLKKYLFGRGVLWQLTYKIVIIKF